jgi:hypothetical protein
MGEARSCAQRYPSRDPSVIGIPDLCRLGALALGGQGAHVAKHGRDRRECREGIVEACIVLGLEDDVSVALWGVEIWVESAFSITGGGRGIDGLS